MGLSDRLQKKFGLWLGKKTRDIKLGLQLTKSIMLGRSIMTGYFIYTIIGKKFLKSKSRSLKDRYLHQKSARQ